MAQGRNKELTFAFKVVFVSRVKVELNLICSVKTFEL